MGRRTQAERQEDIVDGADRAAKTIKNDWDTKVYRTRYTKKLILGFTDCKRSDWRELRDAINEILICDHAIVLVPRTGRGGGYVVREAADIALAMRNMKRQRDGLDRANLEYAKNLAKAGLIDEARTKLAQLGEPIERWKPSETRLHTQQLLTGKRQP